MIYNSGAYLNLRYVFPPFKGQECVTEFCTAVIVIHEGRLEQGIDFTPENAKVEAFKHVT